MNIVALLDEAARRTPDAAAIIDGPWGAERSTSFADLRTRSMQIAALLAKAGVGCGDGIVMLVPMSAVLYAVIAAALRLGAVLIFIDPEKAAAQLEHCRGSLPLKVFVGSPLACLLRLLKPELRALKPAFVAHGWFPGTTSLNTAQSIPPIDHALTDLDDAPAMLSFTSGSTGAAKGLLRNHGLLAATQDILARHLDLHPGRHQPGHHAGPGDGQSRPRSNQPDPRCGPAPAGRSGPGPHCRRHQQMECRQPAGLAVPGGAPCRLQPGAWPAPGLAACRLRRRRPGVPTRIGQVCTSCTAGAGSCAIWFHRGRTHRPARARSDQSCRSRSHQTRLQDSRQASPLPKSG